MGREHRNTFTHESTFTVTRTTTVRDAQGNTVSTTETHTQTHRASGGLGAPTSQELDPVATSYLTLVEPPQSVPALPAPPQRTITAVSTTPKRLPAVRFTERKKTFVQSSEQEIWFDPT